MSVTRRQILQTAAVAGAALAAGPWPALDVRAAPPAVRKWREALTWPAFVDGTAPVTLTMERGTHRFHPDLGAADTLGYRLTSGTVLAPGPRALGAYLGPTLVVPTGVPTVLTAVNAVAGHPLASSLDPALHVLATDATVPRTALHLHGGNTSPADDGGPLDTFPYAADGTPVPAVRRYAYTNGQHAAGTWYHDHALGITRLNVYAGLAAGYLIRDTAATGIDTGDGAALPPPPYEIPLVIQDKRFTPGGGLFYDPSPWVPEFFGDTAVVNGTAWPFHEVARGVYRFRVFNGATARFFRLTFSRTSSGSGLRFWQIGGDGGLLEAPVPMTALLLAPGERADLLVDFRDLSAGETVEVTNNAVAPYPTGGHSARRGGAPLRQLLQFRVTSATGWVPPRPVDGTPLRPLTPLVRLDSLAATAPVRTHSLVEVLDATGAVLTATLNNRPFDDQAYAGFPVQPHTLEVWEFANTTADTHPLHLHLVQFQVLNRQPFDAAGYLRAAYAGPDGLVTLGSGPYPAPSPAPFLAGRALPPPPNERGWKDTVQAPPGTVTRIAVPFGSIAGAPVAAPDVHSGDYVWHCHILEHEDNDMMQRYRIA